VINMTSRKRFQGILTELAAITEEILVVRVLKGRVDELVAIVEHDAEARDWYVEQFLTLLDENYPGPWEVLPYMMYRLRWPEILVHAKATLSAIEAEGGPPSSFGRYVETVVEAFDEVWPNADLWE